MRSNKCMTAWDETEKWWLLLWNNLFYFIFLILLPKITFSEVILCVNGVNLNVKYEITVLKDATRVDQGVKIIAFYSKIIFIQMFFQTKICLFKNFHVSQQFHSKFSFLRWILPVRVFDHSFFSKKNTIILI